MSEKDFTWFRVMCGGLIAAQAALTDIYVFWYDPFSWNLITETYVLVILISVPAVLGGASNVVTMLACVFTLTLVIALMIGALLTPHESFNFFEIMLAVSIVSGLSIQISGWTLRTFYAKRGSVVG